MRAGTGGVDPDVEAADHVTVPSTPPPGGSSARLRPPSPRPRNWRLVGVAIVLVAAAAVLLAEGIGNSLDYFETVDQALSHKALLDGKTFRLEGLVEPGSVRQTSGGVDFVAEGTHKSIEVINTGSPPELFQPDIPVVVVGHFAGSVFVSDQIIVDHSANYIQQHPDRVRAPNGTSR